jgi:multiple sugar transport system substrate-binding protein
MGDKEKTLFDAFAARRLGRREMLDRAARLGLGAAATSALLNAAQTRAMAADYDWMADKAPVSVSCSTSIPMPMR